MIKHLQLQLFIQHCSIGDQVSNTRTLQGGTIELFMIYNQVSILASYQHLLLPGFMLIQPFSLMSCGMLQMSRSCQIVLTEKRKINVPLGKGFEYTLQFILNECEDSVALFFFFKSQDIMPLSYRQPHAMCQSCGCSMESLVTEAF